MKRLAMIALVTMLLFATTTDVCHGFVHRPHSTTPLPNKLPSRPGASSVNLAAMDPHQFDPTLEAESLTVMAHLALDFSGFVLSPSRSLLRLFAVLGRICAISADYIADHSIHTEELMIQLFLISVAVKEWVSDGVPSSSNTTVKTK
jgi:hypothetical protein